VGEVDGEALSAKPGGDRLGDRPLVLHHQYTTLVHKHALY
jgi:hypothetical protein